jgi:ABC-type glycerol-3-phosphate transport system permease component
MKRGRAPRPGALLQPETWNRMMAASLLAMIPCLIVFFFAQRTFIQGAVLSGLKG